MITEVNEAIPFLFTFNIPYNPAHFLYSVSFFFRRSAFLYKPQFQKKSLQQAHWNQSWPSNESYSNRGLRRLRCKIYTNGQFNLYQCIFTTSSIVKNAVVDLKAECSLETMKDDTLINYTATNVTGGTVQNQISSHTFAKSICNKRNEFHHFMILIKWKYSHSSHALSTFVQK